MLAKIHSLCFVFLNMIYGGFGNTNKPQHNCVKSVPRIGIILGSTREGRVTEKIATGLISLLKLRPDVALEIVDLRNFHIPFLNDQIAPAQREVITDAIIKKWSDKISSMDAFIIVVPEYNSGYPGVLKNALDSLYPEWNNKPVAFVGHSGGPSGASNAIAQLDQVVRALKMIPVELSIMIGSSWKAFDEKGRLTDTQLRVQVNKMLDQLLEKLHKKTADCSESLAVIS